MTYDDEKISYPELLEAFFEAQNPKLGSRQYASIIFPHDDEQTKIAKDWIQANKDRRRGDGFMPQMTAIEPLSKFYKAEGKVKPFWSTYTSHVADSHDICIINIGVSRRIPPKLLAKATS